MSAACKQFKNAKECDHQIESKIKKWPSYKYFWMLYNMSVFSFTANIFFRKKVEAVRF